MNDDTTTEAGETGDDETFEPPEAEAAEAEGTGEEGANPSREAASYRHRLREAEGERDAAVAQLTAMRRSEVERLATDQGVKPEALWAADTDLDGLLDEAGTVDREKVDAAVADVKDRFGIENLQVGPVVPKEGTYQPPLRTGDTFESAFSP